jgi:4-hydroxythreonine-4-phosphate dehydrogenase
MNRAPIALTIGEPAGIGPDIALAAAAAHSDAVVLIGDADLLRARAAALRLPHALAPVEGNAPPGAVRVAHVPLAAPCRPGQPDVRSADAVLATLDHAIAGWRAGRYRAPVTAPVDKGVLRRAGHGFSGHTEYLAARLGVADPVMLLVGGGMRVALVTTHVPLREVAAAISAARIGAVVRTLAAALRDWFRIPAPRLAVCGLNPHAGEGGTLGEEEERVIAPALAALRAGGYDLVGPLAADTLFVPERLARFDAVVAMYHDQGLPALKQASFGRAVNVTLGLPLVRTSVDHGVAYDLAATGKADPGSLIAALALAERLAPGQ